MLSITSFGQDWLYNFSNSTISDGKWTFQVSNDDPYKRTLIVTKCITSSTEDLNLSNCNITNSSGSIFYITKWNCEIKSDVTRILMPTTIVEVTDNLINCGNLKYLYFHSDYLTEIPPYFIIAPSDNIDLNLHFPNVKTIKKYAFYNVNSTNDISTIINAAVEHIGEDAFRDSTFCGNLVLTNLQDSVIYGEFGYDLNSVYIFAPNATMISESAFENHAQMKYIKIIAPRLQTIKNYAFFDDYSITNDISDILNETVEYIGENAFSGTSFCGLAYMPSIQYVGSSVFSEPYENETGITGIVIGKNATNVNTTAFSGCKHLEMIQIDCDIDALNKNGIIKFTNTHNITNLTLNCHAPLSSNGKSFIKIMFDKMKGVVANTYNSYIYANRRDGWLEYATPLDNKPPLSYGICIDSSGTSYKAWFIQHPYNCTINFK